MASKPKTVGVRELRQNLSVYLARVKKGQVLKVTEHGQVVAELRPAPADADTLTRLLREGRVTRAPRPVSALPQPLELTLDRPASALLDELRHDTI